MRVCARARVRWEMFMCWGCGGEKEKEVRRGKGRERLEGRTAPRQKETRAMTCKPPLGVKPTIRIFSLIQILHCSSGLPRENSRKVIMILWYYFFSFF